MSLRKRRVALLDGLLSPVQAVYTPVCTTCGRELDSWELVHETAETSSVLAKHHGCEELVVFDLGSRLWTQDDRASELARLIQRHVWFSRRGAL